MNWDIAGGNWKTFKGKVKQQWGKQGATPMVMSVSAFDKYLQDDVQKWATVIRAANIKLD